MARNNPAPLNFDSVPGLSGGGLLYLHAFTSIVPIDDFLTPTVLLNGDNGMNIPDWVDGGPGGKCRSSLSARGH